MNEDTAESLGLELRHVFVEVSFVDIAVPDEQRHGTILGGRVRELPPETDRGFKSSGLAPHKSGTTKQYRYGKEWSHVHSVSFSPAVL
jgi:hypothetical protein